MSVRELRFIAEKRAKNILKVINPETQVIVPASMLELVKEKQFPVQAVYGLSPYQTEEYKGIRCQGIPAI